MTHPPDESAQPPSPRAQSALIVVVPEAEPLVRDLRLKYDAAARLGVPAHVTVLFPFMAPSAISPEVVDRCEALLRKVASFRFRLASVGRFPTTCYLEPTPTEPFVALTNAIWEAFPEYPPYGGSHPAVVPHLTVADGDVEDAEAAADAVGRALARDGPVESVCTEVTLMENSSGLWRNVHSFPLMSGMNSR